MNNDTRWQELELSISGFLNAVKECCDCDICKTETNEQLESLITALYKFRDQETFLYGFIMGTVDRLLARAKDHKREVEGSVFQH